MASIVPPGDASALSLQESIVLQRFHGFHWGFKGLESRSLPDFRVIPSIEVLRQRAGVRALEARHGAGATLHALRGGAEALRARIAGGETIPEAAEAVEAFAASALLSQSRGSLRPVINATGVVIHTNLGRAPLAEAAIARMTGMARGYSNLEYDLETGTRGSRTVHAESLLTALTGAEAAIVVNNNAAARTIAKPNAIPPTRLPVIFFMDVSSECIQTRSAAYHGWCYNPGDPPPPRLRRGRLLPGEVL